MIKKSETKAEYVRLKKSIEEDYKKKLEALGLLYPEFVEKAQMQLPGISVVRSPIKKLVQNSINQHANEQPFTARNVMDWLQKDNPDLANTFSIITVSGALSRLESKGFLEIVEKGSGSTPTTFKKKQQTELLRSVK